MKAVYETTHINFNEVHKTFKIRSGDSLYAFAITPELSLEHLYWGPDLNEDFDLRYLSISSRLLHFNTYEAWKDRKTLNLQDFVTQPETMGIVI
jgi:hypothetical protein